MNRAGGGQRLKFKPIAGMRPSLENRRVADLGIDPSYQRSIDNGGSQSLIRRIAVHWDWALYQPLSVARRDDGSFWVVDGQHRLAAARLRGDLYDLPCVVSPSASVSEEAASFVAMNKTRKPLAAIELFKAALAAGDEDATRIVGLLELAGLSLAPHMTAQAWKPGMIGNVAALQAAYRECGPTGLLRALKVLAAGFSGQVLRYAGTLFPGILTLVGKSGGAEIDDDLLALVLGGSEQSEWRDDINRERGETGARWDAAAAAVLRRAYREAAEEAEA